MLDWFQVLSHCSEDEILVQLQQLENSFSYAHLPLLITENTIEKTKSPTRPLQVFLCHSSNDKSSVQELYQRLCNEDIEPWFDEENLIPGQDWDMEITKAIRTSDVIIVCLSRDSVKKAGYIQKEIKHALDIADEQPQGSIFIIPLKLEECDVPDRLQHLHWVNYSEQKGYEKLARALQFRATELGITLKTEELFDKQQYSVSASNSKKIAADRNANISKIKILFLGTNPVSTVRLKLDEEIREIQINLKLARERDNLELKQDWAVTTNNLIQAILDEQPTIVHFSGHGQQEGIILQNEIGKSKIIDAEALAALFNLFKDNIQCVVLNSCYSEHQAKAIKLHIPYVVGMKSGIPDKAAIAFSTGFYKAIGAGRDIPFAFELGVTAIKLEGISGEAIPVLL